MESYLCSILPPIASRVLTPDALIREAVHDALTEVQNYGGSKTLQIIRKVIKIIDLKRVPTYSPNF